MIYFWCSRCSRPKYLIWAEWLSLPDSGHWLQPLSGLGRSRSRSPRSHSRSLLPRSRSEDWVAQVTRARHQPPGPDIVTQTQGPWGGGPLQNMSSRWPLSGSDPLTLLTFHWCIVLNHFSQFTFQRGGYYQSYQFVITRLSAEII